MLSGLGYQTCLQVLKQSHLWLVTVLICAMWNMITVSESCLHGPFKIQLRAESDSFVHKIIRLRNGQKDPCDYHRSGFVDPYANFYGLQMLPFQENVKQVEAQIAYSSLWLTSIMLGTTKWPLQPMQASQIKGQFAITC